MHTLPATGLRQQAEMLASLSLKHLSSATRNKLADILAMLMRQPRHGTAPVTGAAA